MKAKRGNFFFLILAFLAIPQAWSQAKPLDIDELLGKLSQSVREMNYQGLFTYEVGGVLDTYKLVHQVRDGVEYERLERLNGKEREVLRSGRRSDCLSQGNTLFRSFTSRIENTHAARPFYEFKFAGQKRIAGREAVLVHIEPTDDFRYGYVFGIDTESGLPLKMLILDDRQRVLERIQFVDLETGTSFDEEELLPRSNRHLNIDPKVECDQQSLPVENELNWQASWLPPGFEFSGAHQSLGGDLMLTYTDGLASFSVFVGPNRLVSRVEGTTRVGATLAFVTQRNAGGLELCVTAVGEIPLATAYKVIGNLRQRSDAESASVR